MRRSEGSKEEAIEPFIDKMIFLSSDRSYHTLSIFDIGLQLWDGCENRKIG